MKKNLVLLVALFAINAIYAQSNDLPTAYSKSYELESKGQYAKAAEVLMSVYSENSYETNLRLGWLYYLNADYIKSQNYYKTAIKIYPNSVEPKLGLVYPTAGLQNWNEVTKLYEEILVIDPNNTRANFQLGVTYYVKKDYNKALSYVNKVYALYPFDYDTNIMLTKIYKALSKNDEAKKCLIRAQSYNPTSVEVNDLLKTLSK